LVDIGDPYATRAFDLVKDARLDWKTSSALHGRKLTIGDVIAHSISFNRLESIIKIYSSLLDVDFRKLLGETRDRYAIEVHNEPNVPIIADVDSVLRSVSELIRVRHLLAHEVPGGTKHSEIPLRTMLQDTSLFLSAASEIVSSVVSPDAPLTQADMHVAADKMLISARAVLAEVMTRYAALLGPLELSTFSAEHTAWETFSRASGEHRASEFEGGSMQPTIRLNELTHLTKQRSSDLEERIKGMAYRLPENERCD
jgi:uncharacterized protein YecT (DUF1311 family)